MKYFLGTGSFSPKGECTSDTECAGQLTCINYACINPCNTIPCGPNAYCEPEHHAAWCRCFPGFTENEKGECVSRKYMTKHRMLILRSADLISFFK